MREVCRREVSVGGKVDEAEIDDELGDLEPGDPFLPPDAHAARGLKVVPIHDHVDREIKGDGDPGDCGQPNELGIAEQSCSSVMIGMEEGWVHQSSTWAFELLDDLLRGFFLRTMKKVSNSSTYLVR